MTSEQRRRLTEDRKRQRQAAQQHASIPKKLKSEAEKQRMREWHAAHKDQQKAYIRDFRKNHPEVVKAWRLKSEYGITIEQWNLLYELQGGKCACCQRECVLVTDHDHITFLVRGLLCHTCNKAIGMLGDDVAGVLRALQYLKQCQ